MLKNCKNYTLFFQHFFPLVPPWNHEKKCCPNELKFWEASQNHKWSICWKFQLSISLGTQKESHVGIHIWESCSPLSKKQKFCLYFNFEENKKCTGSIQIFYFDKVVWLETRKLGVLSNFHGRSVQFISEKALATALFFCTTYTNTVSNSLHDLKLF